ncbi:MAG: carbon-nitrogen hydrolase family protein [Polaromonas sp.]|nr:carbon-nitrogen hydrolase family protein [Polaromonas sp.]
MKVAAIQMVSSPDVNTNLASARQLLKQAADAGAELAVLPEYFCLLGFKDTDKLAIAEPAGSGLLQDFLAQCARDYNIWVVGGTIPMASDAPGKVCNSTLVYNPQGLCSARYDKIHLFRFDNGVESYDEARVLIPGAEPVSFDLPSQDGHTWRVGLSICYDLRFPELYRALNADLLLVPSAFTHTTGQAHWEVLLRARAIENLAYVLAAAQGGLHDNQRRTWGHSMVVDAWGHVLASQAEGLGVVLADIDKTALAARRTQLPALGHRSL